MQLTTRLLGNGDARAADSCEGRRLPHFWPPLTNQGLPSSSSACRWLRALSGAARRAQVHGNGPQLDDELLADEEVMAAIREEGSVHRKLTIANTDRTALGRVGGAIARLHGDSGFAGTVSLQLEARGPRPGPGRARVCAPAVLGERAGPARGQAVLLHGLVSALLLVGRLVLHQDVPMSCLCCVAMSPDHDISLSPARRAARGSRSRRSSWAA